MGGGKTSVGRALAARLELPFVDSDEVLARRFGPIAVQIADEGEPMFRAREAEVIHALCDGEPRVLATGGGVFADRALRDVLRARYRLVTLRAPLPVLVGRVCEGSGRPLWGADIGALLDRRTPAYDDVDRVVDVAGLDVDAVVEEVLGWLTS